MPREACLTKNNFTKILGSGNMISRKLGVIILFYLNICCLDFVAAFIDSASGQRLMTTEFAGVLHVRLDYYRQSNNKICDTALLGTDLCDPYFIVSAAPAGCPPLASFESQPVDNAHPTLQFGKQIGQLANPLRFWFRDSDKLGEVLDIQITVKDYDQMIPDELMEQFRWSLPLANLTTGVLSYREAAALNASEPAAAVLTGLRGRGDQLSLQAWVTCRPGRAGPACSSACSPGRPAGPGDGGFACELATGRRVCLPGFVDPGAGCARRDPCAAVGLAPPPCTHGGECVASVNGGGGSSCRCREGFGGPRCQTVLRPCSGGSGPACVHGVCVAATPAEGGSAGQCACDIGYQGDLCDRDIDECQLVSPCQHDSACVNTAGGFECRCRPGFSGRFCQLPPMLLPQPVPAAASAADSAVISSASVLTAVLLSVIAVLALALLLLLLLLLRKRSGSRRGRPQFAAMFVRRPKTGAEGGSQEQEDDSHSCYESIEDPLHSSAGENPYYTDGEKFTNSAYAADQAPLPPPPPPPRLAQSATASHCGDSMATADSHSNCYV